MQKEFINTAAHELRTPIQPILGITDILKGSVKDDKHRELLEVIGRNAQRLKKLSEDILEVSKIESNSMSMYKEHFGIVETILDNINSYKKNTGGKSIKFECGLDGDGRRFDRLWGQEWHKPGYLKPYRQLHQIYPSRGHHIDKRRKEVNKH